MALFGIILVVFIGVFVTAVTTILKAIVSGKFKNSGNYDAGFELHQQAHKLHCQMHQQSNNMFHM